MRLIHLIPFTILFFSSAAFPGQVVKTKDKKVFITFSQDEPFTTGDNFFLTNAEGKKLGLVEIKKAKGNKAIGILKKGKAETGFATLFKSAGKKAKKASTFTDSYAEDEDSSGRPSRKGILVGYGMATQDVDQGATISAQDGTSMAVRGVYDYSLLSSVYVRGMLGVELLSVEGTGTPITGGATTTIGTDITYATFDALIHWSLMQGSSLNLYLLGGMSILYPVAKSSTSLFEDSIDGLAIGQLGGGIELRAGKSIFPLEVAYYLFPSGSDVKTSVISVKLGWLF